MKGGITYCTFLTLYWFFCGSLGSLRVVIPGASKCIVFPCTEISISAMRGSSLCVIHIPSFVANTQCLKYIIMLCNTSYYRIHLLMVYSNHGRRVDFLYKGLYIYRRAAGMGRLFQLSSIWLGRKLSTLIYQWVEIFKLWYINRSYFTYLVQLYSFRTSNILLSIFFILCECIHRCVFQTPESPPSPNLP